MKKISEEEQKCLALLGRCCNALTLNLLTQALASSYLAPQDGEGNKSATWKTVYGTRIPVKLQWEYMWSYRWLKVIDKEILAPRLQRKQVEKLFNGGSMLVLG
jgi:hypothetical protein